MSRGLFTALVALVALERLVELGIARRHRRRLLARGAREVGAAHYPAMVAVHAGLLVAAPLEVWLLERPFRPALGWPMVLLVVATMGLRYWVIATLGERWTTRILVLPGTPRIRSGPYRWLRHPNYLAVAVEVVALPLVHGAWVTAVVFGAANLLVLTLRMRAEDAALTAASPSEGSPSTDHPSAATPAP